MKMMRPQIRAPHCGQTEASEAHPTQHIDFEESHPIGIGYVFKRLGFEDSKVVDENLDVRMPSHHFLSRGSGAEIAGESLHRPTRGDLDF
jgi:hypothetical protein